MDWLFKSTTKKVENKKPPPTPTPPPCKASTNEKGDTTYKKVRTVNGLLVIENCCPPNLTKKINEDGTFTCVKPKIQPKIVFKTSTIVQPQTDQPRGVEPQSVRNKKS
jgi:hypothetical protein